MRCLTVALVSLLLLPGLQPEDATFTAPQKLAGKTVSADVLNKGRVHYLQYCRPCHGDKGDGRGPSAPAFGRRPQLHSRRIQIRLGAGPEAAARRGLGPHRQEALHGTAMLGWEVPDD